MNRFLFAFSCAALVCGLAASASFADDATAPAPAPAIYVGSFQSAEASTGQGFGPLHGLSSSLHTHRVDENAEKLSQALVRALRAHGRPAQALSLAGASPSSGWIVRGVFYSLDSDSHLISVPFMGKKKGPNVEVTVTIADAAKDANTPFAVIGTDAALRGQGSAISWNPYIVAAKFVIHTVEGDRSIEALANEIATKILDNRAALDRNDPAHQS
jgi:hypothetical protein